MYSPISAHARSGSSATNTVTGIPAVGHMPPTGPTPRHFTPEDVPRLPALGIGLTDLAKDAFGPDTAIRREHYDPGGLEARIRACRPSVLAFNGKRPASVFLRKKSSDLGYGIQSAIPNFPVVFILPSTSGLARANWNPAHWHSLAAAVSGSKLLP